MEEVIQAEVWQNNVNFTSSAYSLAKKVGLKIDIEYCGLMFWFPRNIMKFQLKVKGEATQIKNYKDKLQALL